MHLPTYRTARLLMVKDSILAMCARLGEYTTQEINEIQGFSTEDGWYVSIEAFPGSGLRIIRLLEVTITTDQPGERYRFNMDVVGKSQCRNVTFPGMQLEEMDEDEFADVCMLPELLGDFLAVELKHRYGQ